MRKNSWVDVRAVARVGAWVGVGFGMLTGQGFAASGDSPSVTIPLEQYIELRKRTEAPSVTTIEEIRFSGDMKQGGPLRVKIAGSSTGLLPAKPVFEITDSFSLSGCDGAAMLESKDGMIAIIPQRPGRFALECDVLPKAPTEFIVATHNALSVRSAVVGGEMLARSAGGERKEYSLTRSEPSRAQVSGPVSATGRYQVTVFPDDSRFRYFISFYNPNKTTQAFDLPLRNGESVQEVQTSAVYDEAKGALKFKLPPGDTRATVSGKLAPGKFTPPLESSQQFLVLENHPLLQLQPQTRARRISLGETGLAPKFAGALGFYVRPGDEFSWASRKLAFFESDGYTVDRADYRYFVPRAGEGIVEAEFAIDNKGTPSIPLKVPGKASYLEIDSVPQVLYKDDNGQLLIHLPAGRHQIMVQYRPTKGNRGLAGGVSEQLLKPDSVVSEMSVTFLVDRAWKLMFGRALAETRAFVDFFSLGVFAGVFVLYSVLFGWMTLPRRDRFLAAAGPAAVAWWFPGYLSMVLAVWCVGGVWRFRTAIWRKLTSFGSAAGSWSWKRGLGFGLAALVVFVGSLTLTSKIATVFERSGMRQRFDAASARLNEASDSEATEMDVVSKLKPDSARGYARPQSGAKNAAFNAPQQVAGLGAPGELNEDAVAPIAPSVAGGTGGGSGSEEAYQGIPARIRIPAGAQSFYFHGDLIEKEAGVFVRAALVSRWVPETFAALLMAVAVLMLWMNRRRVVEFCAGTSVAG